MKLIMTMAEGEPIKQKRQKRKGGSLIRKRKKRGEDLEILPAGPLKEYLYNT